MVFASSTTTPPKPMKLPNILILADRGHFKAFSTEDNGSGRNRLHVVKSLLLSEGQERFGEKFTDRAGGFPSGGMGGQGNSVAERMTLVAEEEMRSFRHLAREISEILVKQRPARWGFAAPSEINGAILDGVPSALLKNLAVNLKQDLVNMDEGAIAEHFLE